MKQFIIILLLFGLCNKSFTGMLRVEGSENCTLKIFAVDGRQVHVQTLSGVDATVRLEHLPADMYIIHLENGGRSKTIKVIKI